MRQVIRLFDLPFPFCQELFDDESGLGFCLRVVTTNGGKLHLLRKMLGIGRSVRFNAVHAQKLAPLLGVDASRLAYRLPIAATVAPGVPRRCYGHVFRVAGLLRMSRPQLCALCIQESGYLKAHWDIGLSSCCVKHGLGFTDKCLRCGSAVRWDRRSVEWGHCGHHLGRTGTSVADGKQLQVQRLLDGVFYRQQLSQVLAEFSLHPCIGLLSMDGLIHTLYAFGLLHGPWAATSAGALAKCLSPGYAKAIAARGLVRLQAWSNEYPYAGEKLAPVVAAAAFIKVIVHPVTPQDRSIALGMYGSIFGRRELEQLKSRHAALGQKSLFEETL